MFIVVFEVHPRPEHRESYLQVAARLKPALTACDGFLENERFTSSDDDGKVLSVSTWRDEQSLIRWRSHGDHRRAQEQGRAGLFENYRLRVGEILLESEGSVGASFGPVAAESRSGSSVGVLTLTEISADRDALNAWREQVNAAHPLMVECFSSINLVGKQLVLAAWQGIDAWSPQPFPGALMIRHRVVRIARDYGMFDRGEAPQCFPRIQGATEVNKLR